MFFIAFLDSILHPVQSQSFKPSRHIKRFKLCEFFEICPGVGFIIFTLSTVTTAKLIWDKWMLLWSCRQAGESDGSVWTKRRSIAKWVWQQSEMYDVGRRRKNLLSGLVQVPHWIPPPVLSPQLLYLICPTPTGVLISIFRAVILTPVVTGGNRKRGLMLQQTLLCQESNWWIWLQCSQTNAHCS